MYLDLIFFRYLYWEKKTKILSKKSTFAVQIFAWHPNENYERNLFLMNFATFPLNWIHIGIELSCIITALILLFSCLKLSVLYKALSKLMWLDYTYLTRRPCPKAAKDGAYCHPWCFSTGLSWISFQISDQEIYSKPNLCLNFSPDSKVHTNSVTE